MYDKRTPVLPSLLSFVRMVLGSIIGGLADSYGRKRLCLCYCLSYTFSVLMKHCRHFHVLLLGRVGGGLATSLLFSVFESWLIRAHGERGLLINTGEKKDEEGGQGGDEEKWLARSLSVSMYGSSLVAIGSGVVANVVVESSGKMRPLWSGGETSSSSIYVGGYISAFDACLVPLGLCAALILAFWEENYGEVNSSAASTSKGVELPPSTDGHHKNDNRCQERQLFSDGYLKKHSSVLLEDESVEEDRESSSIQSETECNNLLEEQRHSITQQQEGMCSALIAGIRTVWNTPKILICCIIGSVFEGAMYIFIFLWTPALTSLQEKLNLSNRNIVDKIDIIENAEKDIHDVDGELPFGWIFSSFMVCCMLGTIAFSTLTNAGVPASKCLAGILALSSLSCLAMACPFSGASGGTTSANTPQYVGMLMYEFCIGF